MKFFKSMLHAWHGIIHTTKSQRNFRIQVIYAIIAIFLSILLPLSASEWFYVSLAIITVFMAEMANTITEYLCDLIHKEKNIIVKHIKDIAAGIVLISATWSLIIGGIIFIPKLFLLFL